MLKSPRNAEERDGYLELGTKHKIISPRNIDKIMINGKNPWQNAGFIIKDVSGNNPVQDFSQSLEEPTFGTGKIIYAGYFICNTCLKHLENSSVPPCSAENGAGFSHCPKKEILTRLTTLEARIVSPRLPFMWLKTLPGSNMSSMKGTLTCVTTDTVTNVANIPRNLDNDVIPAIMKKKMSNKTIYLKEKIRPKYVQSAANYLTAQKLYKEIGITPINPSWTEMSEEGKTRKLFLFK